MNGEKELFSEDFELVTESSFRSPDTELAPGTQQQRGPIVNVNAESSNERESSSLMAKRRSIESPYQSMDPYQTFELIHNEHQALKGLHLIILTALCSVFLKNCLFIDLQRNYWRNKVF